MQNREKQPQVSTVRLDPHGRLPLRYQAENLGLFLLRFGRETVDYWDDED